VTLLAVMYAKVLVSFPAMIRSNQGYGRDDDRDGRKDNIEDGLFSNFSIMVHGGWICRVPSERLPRIQL